MSSPIDYLLGELNDQGQLVGLDKGLKRFFGQLTIEGIASLIKLQRKHRNIIVANITHLVSHLVCL